MRKELMNRLIYLFFVVVLCLAVVFDSPVCAHSSPTAEDDPPVRLPMFEPTSGPMRAANRSKFPRGSVWTT
jgi:hypothetical protein